MKISAASLILLFFAVSHSYAAPEADLSNFRKSVLPLLSKYCMDCHDWILRKGVSTWKASPPTCFLTTMFSSNGA